MFFHIFKHFAPRVRATTIEPAYLGPLYACTHDVGVFQLVTIFLL